MTDHSSSPSREDKTDDAARSTITKQDIHDILTECVAFPETADDSAPLVIDLYAATWISHLLEERYGLVVMLSYDVAASLNSLDAVYAFVSQALGRPGPAEVGGARPQDP